MQKNISILLILLLTFALSSCSKELTGDEDKDPFFLLKDSSSYYYYDYTTFDSGDIIKADVYYESYGDDWIIYHVMRNHNSKFYKTSKYIYDYNFSNSKWYRSTSGFVNDNQIDFSDKNNFEYDQTTDVYSLKKHIDAGDYLSYTIKMEGKNVVVTFTLAGDGMRVTSTRTYSKFNEKFNLSIPKDYIVE